MKPIEIIVMVGAILVVLLVIGTYIYKRYKGLPTGECAYCHSKKKVNKMVNSVRKELDEEKCHCNSQ